MQIIASVSRPSGKGTFDRLKQQPLMEVLGLLIAAGAAKSGYGEWIVGGILSLVPIYFGAVVTLVTTRNLAARIARIQLAETSGFKCGS